MNRVKQLREAKGWNQTELGEQLNVKAAAISKYEKGDVSLTGDTLNKLAKIFGVSADYLLGDKEFDTDVIAKRVSSLRHYHKISTEELSRELGYWDYIIGEVEAGEFDPDVKMVENIADYFNVPTDYLLGRTDNPNFGTTTADPNRPYTIDDWPDFLAQLPEDQAMHYQGVEYPDDQKLKIMELARKAKQKKQAKINKLLEYPDEVIDDALIYAAFDLEKRKKMSEED